MNGAEKSGSSGPWALGLVLAVVFFAVLWGPTTAGAETFTVDSTGDAPQHASGPICETEAGDCTLRAAIDAANGHPGLDQIGFDPSVFTGALSGTIKAATALPAITGPLEIVDGCPRSEPGFPEGTCAGLDASGLAIGFLVETDEVTIAGLAITGATTGIEVIGSGDEFAARRDQFGADLAGEPGPVGTGIRLGPGANDAEIGTYTSNGVRGGNTFVNSAEVALDLEGASRARIQDNVFGTLGGRASNGTDIEITDVSTGGQVVKAVENEIGAKKSRLGELSEGCSEFCNVIAGATVDGVNLEGDGGAELPATGPTTILGNVFGVDTTRLYEVAQPDENAGIAVGSARKVSIGGPQEASEGNRFVGGHWAVTAGPEARELTIEGNVIGESSGPYPHLLDPPSEGGFSIDSSALTYDEALAWVVGNRIHLDGGTGIAAHGRGLLILGNEVYGGDTGIQVDGYNGGWYGAIDGNYLELPSAYGIRVESSDYRVRGNFIYGAGEAGIRVEPGGGVLGSPQGVRIGGESEPHGEFEEEARVQRREAEAEEDENEIDGSGGPAIEIVGEDTRYIEVSRNFGDQNSGPFIDLGGDGAGNPATGPNAGTQAPVILDATPDLVTGVANAMGGGIVSVFLKSTSSPGEIEEFLGAGYVHEGGAWSVELPESLPVGTEIAAGETLYYGSSEMSFGTVVPGPPKVIPPGDEEGGDEEVLPGGGGDTGRPTGRGDNTRTKATTPPVAAGPKVAPKPVARIVSGPPTSSHRTRARFRIAAPAGDPIECSLDGPPSASVTHRAPTSG